MLERNKRLWICFWVRAFCLHCVWVRVMYKLMCLRRVTSLQQHIGVECRCASTLIVAVHSVMSLKNTHIYMYTHTHTQVHCASPFSLCVSVYECAVASVLLRFFPSPTCQQCRIVFPLQPLSLSCGWRLESWPNVLRIVCISCCHLTANNESIWGLHLKHLSLPTPSFLPALYLFFRFVFVWLTVAWHLVSVHQSSEPLTASSPMEWSILLKCWLSKSLLCGRQVMECTISTRACCTLLLYTFTLCWGAVFSHGFQPFTHSLQYMYSNNRCACTLWKAKVSWGFWVTALICSMYIINHASETIQ